MTEVCCAEVMSKILCYFGSRASQVTWASCPPVGRTHPVTSLILRAGFQPARPAGKMPAPPNSQDGCVTVSCGFPNLSQWTFGSVDRVIIRHRQGCNIVIGFRTLARETPKQIPFATTGVSSDHTE